MTLAVRADGTLYSWGANDDDQLGRPGLTQTLVRDSTGVYPHPQPVQPAATLVARGGGLGLWRGHPPGWLALGLGQG
ncbi:MAG: hypothetical protein ACRYFX_03485 [Janthinobacterium lividum]